MPTPTTTSSATPLQLTEAAAPAKPPRKLRAGLRFHGDRSKQLDAIKGSPDAMVPPDHKVRDVIRYVEVLDLTALRNKHSSLGRKPVDPRFKLQVWLYASLVGMHHASEIARALETDAAMRLAAGGHEMSDSMLKLFRRENGAFFGDLMKQVLSVGIQEGLVDPRDLATDSMRLRADVSTESMRMKARSEARLKTLDKVDLSTLSAEARAAHEDKVAKHTAAVERCEEEERTSHSVTDPQASMMKFPNGATLPGHRMTITSSGSASRFLVSVLVDGDPTDFGKLGPAVLGAREALMGAGVPVREGAPPMQVAADGGYMSQADLEFAAAQREAGRIDILLPQPTVPVRTNKATGEQYFGRDEFTVEANGEVICPAGKLMLGPYKDKDGTQHWRGRGCADCPLRAACTPGKQRTLSINATTDALHKAVVDRLAEPGGKERYNRRIATVEPVFSYLEDTMRFTRSSSRLTKTVLAEVLLKAVAYNITRLAAAKARGASARAVRLELVVTSAGAVVVAVWIRRGDESVRIPLGALRASNGAAGEPWSPSERALGDLPTPRMSHPRTQFQTTL